MYICAQICVYGVIVGRRRGKGGGSCVSVARPDTMVTVTAMVMVMVMHAQWTSPKASPTHHECSQGGIPEIWNARRWGQGPKKKQSLAQGIWAQLERKVLYDTCTLNTLNTLNSHISLMLVAIHFLTWWWFCVFTCALLRCQDSFWQWSSIHPHEHVCMHREGCLCLLQFS